MEHINKFKKFYASLSAGIVTVGTAIVVSPASGITASEVVAAIGMLLASGAVLFAENQG